MVLPGELSGFTSKLEAVVCISLPLDFRFFSPKSTMFPSKSACFRPNSPPLFPQIDNMSAKLTGVSRSLTKSSSVASVLCNGAGERERVSAAGAGGGGGEREREGAGCGRRGRGYARRAVAPLLSNRRWYCFLTAELKAKLGELRAQLAAQ
eukprot:3177848-Rhodomonas_salina.1